MKPFTIRLALASLFVGAIGGAGVGWAATSVDYQSRLNRGLVNATDSVLRNALGEVVGGATMVSGGDSGPDTLFIDLDSASKIRVNVRVFDSEIPPDPCVNGSSDFFCDTPTYQFGLGAQGPVCQVGIPPDPCRQ
jgi:hypothetical protein